jgi:hypothetical protein
VWPKSCECLYKGDETEGVGGRILRHNPGAKIDVRLYSLLQ